MTDAASALAPPLSVPELLSIKKIETSDHPASSIALFQAPRNHVTFAGRLYGGQMLGQGLAAAAATAPGRLANSLHAYFLRGGQPDKPVQFSVDHVRDGRVFANRRVEALQGDKVIFVMDCAFRTQGAGWEHQESMPEVVPPERLEDIRSFSRAIDPELPVRISGHFAGNNPIELRPVSGAAALARQTGTRRLAWLRIPSMKGNQDPVLLQAALAWLSDYWISSAALVLHRHPLPGLDIFLTSLDHAIWFHRQVSLDDWLLYDTESPSSSAGTGLHPIFGPCFMQIFG